MHVWIVEMWIPGASIWQPTDGAALTKQEGQAMLADWEHDNPNDVFLLHRYERTEDRTG